MPKLLTLALITLTTACTQTTTSLDGEAPAEPMQTQTVQSPDPDFPNTRIHQNGHDWANFLGPQYDGTSNETGLLLDWPDEGPPVLWSRPVGESYGNPVVANGKLIIFHRIEDEEVIECIDAVNGEETFWQFRYPTDYADRYNYNGGPRGSATINEDHVYTLGAEGVLTAVNFQTGELNWQRNINQDFNAPQNFFGVGVAPFIEQDMILINVGGSGGAGIVAFDKYTGETIWKASGDTASYSTPIVKTINEKRTAIFHTGDGLVTLEAETGEILHKYRFRSRHRESAIAATPLYINDTIFLSATYRIGAVALKITPSGLEEVWKSVDAMQNHWATSIYQDGYLYGLDGRHPSGAGGANFRCIDFNTGKVQWTHTAGSERSGGIGRSTFIMAEDHLIALGEYGHLLLIKPDPKQYIEKERVRLLQHPAWAPPILAQGLLYIRNENTLLCLDLRNKPDPPQ
jgi:outer membrane protein assembly factor BamB